jgi:hypothetical protein
MSFTGKHATTHRKFWWKSRIHLFKIQDFGAKGRNVNGHHSWKHYAHCYSYRVLLLVFYLVHNWLIHRVFNRWSLWPDKFQQTVKNGLLRELYWTFLCPLWLHWITHLITAGNFTNNRCKFKIISRSMQYNRICSRNFCPPRILRTLLFKGWFWIYFCSPYFTHHRIVHLPVIPLTTRFTKKILNPKYRTSTLMLVLENKGLLLFGSLWARLYSYVP